RQHYQRLVYQVNKIIRDYQMAEDIVQDTFIKVMKHISSIQSKESITAWLSVIARRTAIDRIRYEQNNQGVLLEQEDLVKLNKEHNQDVEKEVEFQILIENVQKEIRGLNNVYQDVMMLKLKKELKDREIASQLNLKLSTVKTRINRARKQLIHQFQD